MAAVAARNIQAAFENALRSEGTSFQRRLRCGLGKIDRQRKIGMRITNSPGRAGQPATQASHVHPHREQLGSLAGRHHLAEAVHDT
jgi:hypothetical protein